MVGGGLSRCAVKARPDAGDAPLWYDLATELTKRLYPRPDSEGRPAEPGDKPTTGDLLSLAQEYETAFGRRDLHLFLQQQIRDGDFTPGGVHEQLMRLPWRDVFTTNWDTLLERTGPEVVDRRMCNRATPSSWSSTSPHRSSAASEHRGRVDVALLSVLRDGLLRRSEARALPPRRARPWCFLSSFAVAFTATGAAGADPALISDNYFCRSG